MKHPAYVSEKGAGYDWDHWGYGGITGDTTEITGDTVGLLGIRLGLLRIRWDTVAEVRRRGGRE